MLGLLQITESTIVKKKKKYMDINRILVHSNMQNASLKMMEMAQKLDEEDWIW